MVATLTVVFALAASASLAGVGNPNGTAPGIGALKAYVPDSLLSAVQQNPKQSFDVIVQGDRREPSHGFIQKVLQARGADSVGSGNVKQEFASISGGQLTLTGRQILFLARSGLAQSIVPNETVQQTDYQLPNSNRQLWPWAVGAPVDWSGSASGSAPTIAVIDSGIDSSRSDVSGRVVGEVNLASLGPNSPGDGDGHGTFVAGIAAGAASGYAGVSPKSRLLSIDVMNDNGQATVADVIAACDWILAHKATYNIRVANLSLHSVNRASILFDPLDQAVEKLWLNGVVVVAAAGNYAVGGAASGVPFAPGNDPFVITVGAADIGTTVGATDDVAAPWSAWGYTPDGFRKPDVGAPGRYLIGPVSPGTTLYTTRPDKVTAPGYMQLSGTSFAAPVVSGIAAELIAQHPGWTPDQVKGALMVSTLPTPHAAAGSLGVGLVYTPRAKLVQSPPNPNAGLNQFVSSNVGGTNVFDAAAWQSAARSGAAWNSAAWESAAWSDAAWESAAWSDAAWSDAAWESAAWGSAAWSDAAWSDAAWADAAWADNAESDLSVGLEPTALAPDVQDAVLAELGIAP